MADIPRFPEGWRFYFVPPSPEDQGDEPNLGDAILDIVELERIWELEDKRNGD